MVLSMTAFPLPVWIMPPPWLLAKLPLSVELVTVSVPLPVWEMPAPVTAAFRLKVELTMVALSPLLLSMPPPSPEAVLPLKVQPVTVQGAAIGNAAAARAAVAVGVIAEGRTADHQRSGAVDAAAAGKTGVAAEDAVGQRHQARV